MTTAVLHCSFLGFVPRKVHRHRFLPPLLQAYSEQTSRSERPRVHRSRVLQLTHLDQVGLRIKTLMCNLVGGWLMEMVYII